LKSSSPSSRTGISILWYRDHTQCQFISISLKHCRASTEIYIKELAKHLCALDYKWVKKALKYTLIAALELGRRRKDEEALERKKISGSKDAFLLLSELLSDLDHEQFWIIYLNRGGYLLKRVRISEGGIAGTVVDPKIIFMHALELKASTIILAHNHPSGNLQPSQADIQITKKVQEGGKMLDIFVADHIIIANSSFYSFADEGLL
jgi:DNA repair protein RadC